MDTLLTPREAAEILRIAPRTLETWRRRGDGPSFVRIPSGVRYQRADLEAYLAESRVAAE